MHLAYTAWDLQKLSQGRFMLGLGTQVKANVERRFSATWSHPVDRMADTVAALQGHLRLLAGRRAPRLPRAVLELHADAADVQPRTAPVGARRPILVGALGPRMTRMVASCADGVLLHPFMSGRFFRLRTLAARRRWA